MLMRQKDRKAIQRIFLYCYADMALFLGWNPVSPDKKLIFKRIAQKIKELFQMNSNFLLLKSNCRYSKQASPPFVFLSRQMKRSLIHQKDKHYNVSKTNQQTCSHTKHLFVHPQLQSLRMRQVNDFNIDSGEWQIT